MVCEGYQTRPSSVREAQRECVYAFGDRKYWRPQCYRSPVRHKKLI